MVYTRVFTIWDLVNWWTIFSSKKVMADHNNKILKWSWKTYYLEALLTKDWQHVQQKHLNPPNHLEHFLKSPQHQTLVEMLHQIRLFLTIKKEPALLFYTKHTVSSQRIILMSRQCRSKFCSQMKMEKEQWCSSE